MSTVAGVIMPATEKSKYGPLIMTGGWRTPLATLLGTNFGPDGSWQGFRDIEILSSPAFKVANVPDLEDAEDLGTSVSESLVWNPQISSQTSQSQCVHFVFYDIHASQMSQSIRPGSIFPADQMVSGNRYIDFTKVNQVDSYQLQETIFLSYILDKMEWVMFNSVLQVPTSDIEKWRGQGILNGCTNVIDAANAELTSSMLTELSLLVPPMANPALFIPGEFFEKIKSYTIPAANIGPLSEPLTYVSLSTQPVRVYVEPQLKDKNTIVLMDIAKCRLSFFQTVFEDDGGNQQFNDVVFSTSVTSKQTGAKEGRIGTYFALNPGSFSHHAVLKNVLTAPPAP